MDKREQIERALDLFLYRHHCVTLGEDKTCLAIDRLVEQAIVIECEVDNTYGAPESPWTVITMNPVKGAIRQNISYPGLHGASGKAIAIILSLEEE